MDSSIIFFGSVMDADMVKLYLEGNGISAWLDDEGIGTWAPHYASAGGVMAVKVRVADSDIDQAKELLKQMNNADERIRPTPWKCPQCGEEIEGQFTQFWNCNTVRDADKQ